MVKALKSFYLTDPNQLKEAAHYTNIQPLLKTDNLKKGSKFTEHDLAVQREKFRIISFKNIIKIYFKNI